MLKNSSDSNRESLFLCKDHYLECDYEGFDVHEIKILDKNINTYVANSTKPSLQKYTNIDDFLRSFQKLKANDLGCILIHSNVEKEIELKFIKRTIIEDDIAVSYVTFSKNIQTDDPDFEELRLMLNFSNPDCEFIPPIGLTPNRQSYCTICRDEDELECCYNDKIWNEYRWMCQNSDCIEYYTHLEHEEESSNKYKTLELCIMHKTMKYQSAVHTAQHKMILVKVENGKTDVIQNEKDYFDATISRAYDDNRIDKSLDTTIREKEEIILCDLCESVIYDHRWHCIDCYEDKLGADLCSNCWEHHNRVHHLAVLDYNKDPLVTDRKWNFVNIIRILDVQTDNSYSCLICGCKLSKIGLCISFNVVIECLGKNVKSINSDFLLCLDDFIDENCSKLESVYPCGSYSLVEWITQYDRRGWHEVISNISKKELRQIISYMNLMNKGAKMECTICSAPVNEKIWICMEQNCNKTVECCSSKLKINDYCALICEHHIGANQLSQNNAYSHKIVCMFRGKIQNSATGTSEMWIPKNLFRNHPHLVEKRLYLQKQIMNKVNTVNLILVIKSNHSICKYNLILSHF